MCVHWADGGGEQSQRSPSQDNMASDLQSPDLTLALLVAPVEDPAPNA